MSSNLSSIKPRSKKSKDGSKKKEKRVRPKCICGVEWTTGVLIIAIFKGIGLFLMLTYAVYRFSTDTIIQYFEETRFSATWGYLIYTLMLPVPTFITFIIALIKKASICARFTLMCLYFAESIFVLGWPLGFLRSVIIGLRNDD